jgi:hypothetical protein
MRKPTAETRIDNTAKNLPPRSKSTRLFLFRRLISPTNKWKEGRSPVWGSAFTIKNASLQGGSEEIDSMLNVKLWVLVAGGAIPGFWNNRAQSFFESFWTL